LEARKLQFYEEKVLQIKRFAAYFQLLGIVTLGSILYYQPSGYNQIGTVVSLFCLLASFAISKWYIYNGKKIETLKTFNEIEKNEIMREYLLRFWAPYILWIGSAMFFGGR